MKLGSRSTKLSSSSSHHGGFCRTIGWTEVGAAGIAAGSASHRATAKSATSNLHRFILRRRHRVKLEGGRGKSGQNLEVFGRYFNEQSLAEHIHRQHHAV